MEKKSSVKKVANPIAQILDENNFENVVLLDENNKPIEFTQIGVFYLEDTDKLYTIMVPITPMVGVSEGEGVLFEIDEEKQEIQVVNDEETIDKVIKIYEKMKEGK